MAIFQGTAIPTSGEPAYTIDQSLRFNDDDSAYLSRTPASAGNRKTWTLSAWVKLGSLSQGERGTILHSNGGPTIYQDSGLRFAHAWDPAGTDYVRETVAVFRDPSAWYHVVWWCDTTQAGTRWRIYVNGAEQSLQTPSGQNGEPAQNTDLGINSTNAHTIGVFAASSYFDGYMAEVHFIDGQALDASYFGETDETYGHWKPKAYTGTYGTNGFYLDFSNSASLGEDQAGSNDFTATNLAATDVVLDSPTNNFCTMTPLAFRSGINTIVLSEGNLRVTQPNSARSFGSFSVSSGKWYWEIFIENNGTVDNHDYRGIINLDWGQSSTGTLTRFIYDSYNGTYWIDSGSNTASDIGTANNPDIIGFAWDADNGYMTVSVNGVAGTTITGLTTGIPMCPYVACDYNTVDVMNFGQDSSFAGNKTAQNNTDDNGYGDFYYSPPSGFLALCTANLSDPAVVPGENFNTVLWTGNGSTQSITGVGFQPDWVWTKDRGLLFDHTLFDAVRGATKFLRSNGTTAEETRADSLTSFDSDGFSVGADSVRNNINRSGSSYVSWNWKADNTSGSTNTDGSITSTIAANVDAGFSIVSYTGDGSASHNVGHGLSQTPDMIIAKTRNAASTRWVVAHKDIPTTNRLVLDDTFASAADGDRISAYNSTTFTHNWNGANSNTFIAYCFHSVDGYSKFGSYTGNGSSDGPFVYTGFMPAFVIAKRTDSANSWTIQDDVREPDNPVDRYLLADDSGAEGTSGLSFDFLSNGFKLRTASGAVNASGGTYIYMAFAEYDFKHSNGR